MKCNKHCKTERFSALSLPLVSARKLKHPTTTIPTSTATTASPTTAQISNATTDNDATAAISNSAPTVAPTWNVSTAAVKLTEHDGRGGRGSSAIAWVLLIVVITTTVIAGQWYRKNGKAKSNCPFHD